MKKYCGAPRAHARGSAPHASSGETLRSVSSFAKATEDTLIHPLLYLRARLSPLRGGRYKELYIYPLIIITFIIIIIHL